MRKFFTSAGSYGAAVRLMEEASEGGGGSDKLFDFMDDDEEQKEKPYDGDDKNKGDDDKDDDSASASGEDDGNSKSEQSTEDEFDTDELIKTDGDGSQDGGDNGGGASAYTADQLSILAKELELVEGETTISTIDELKTSYKAKLEASRKTVNLDDYSPSSRRIITMLESGMGEDAIFTNEKIANANAILSMDAKDKVLESRILSLESAGLPSEEAEQRALAIVGAMSADDVKKEADSIDAGVRSLREDEIERIRAEHQQHVDSVNKRNEEKVKAEKQAILNEVRGLKEFMGMKLGSNTIAAIEKAIEDGTFERTIRSNQAKTLVDAYLMSTVGKTVLTQLRQAVEEAGEKNLLKGMKAIMKHIAPNGKTRSESVAQGEKGKSVRLPWAED